MNISDLREAQVRYHNRIDRVSQNREELYQVRDSFTKFFNRNKIRRMNIDDYVAGVELPENGYNFCYTLERQLDGLGRIIGATAFKFGVYYGRTKSDENYEYRFTKKFGETYQEAFKNVKETILELLEAGENEDIDLIAKNILSPMFKGKILCTYYPERYLNVFSPDHLNYFLIQLDLDTKEILKKDAIYKREVLIAFKNQDKIMKNWSVDLFSDFLYTEYPGRPPKDNQNTEEVDPLAEYRMPEFPADFETSLIDLEIISPNSKNERPRKKSKPKSGKPDYDKEAKKLKKLGDRGEKIVLDFERDRLRKAGHNDLAEKVDRVSLKSDSYGYDILSFETDGTKRFIEVKATSMKVGLTNFFLSSNELETAKELDNYYIYMVYDVVSKTPKVWVVGNPFNPENDKMQIRPMNFKVTINTRNK